MSGFDRRLVWNTRERLLSDDMNNSVNLLETKGTDEICAAMSRDRFRSGTPVSGIMSGGKVTANGSTLDVFISPMIGWKYGTPATTYDSAYLKVETATELVQNLSGQVDGAADRWVCIEVSPGEIAEVSEQRDIFNPTLGTFIPQNVDVVYEPAPVVTVNVGVPSANPVLPPGTPGTIPLAYVYLQAGTSSIDDDDIVMCRPLFNVTTPDFNQYGVGGLDVDNVGTTLVKPVACSYKFGLQGRSTTVIPRECNCNLPSLPNWATFETFVPNVDYTPVYAYAALPPYPSGYDQDVANNRELVTSPTFSRIPSMVDNPVGNGLLVWSTTEPVIGLAGIGPRSGGDFEINDPTWGDGQIKGEGNFYVGCVSNWGTAVNPGLARQKTTAGRVAILETDKLPRDFSQLGAGGSIAQNGDLRNISPLLLDSYGIGNFQILPNAREWTAYLIDQNNGNSTEYTVFVTSFTTPIANWEMRDNSIVSKGYLSPIESDISGVFGYSHDVQTNTNTFVLIVYGYTDPVLGAR